MLEQNSHSLRTGTQNLWKPRPPQNATTRLQDKQIRPYLSTSSCKSDFPSSTNTGTTWSKMSKVLCAPKSLQLSSLPLTSVWLGDFKAGTNGRTIGWVPTRSMPANGGDLRTKSSLGGRKCSFCKLHSSETQFSWGHLRPDHALIHAQVALKPQIKLCAVLKRMFHRHVKTKTFNQDLSGETFMFTHVVELNKSDWKGRHGPSVISADMSFVINPYAHPLHHVFSKPGEKLEVTVISSTTKSKDSQQSCHFLRSSHNMDEQKLNHGRGQHHFLLPDVSPM